MVDMVDLVDMFDMVDLVDTTRCAKVNLEGEAGCVLGDPRRHNPNHLGSNDDFKSQCKSIAKGSEAIQRLLQTLSCRLKTTNGLAFR